jgi:DNA repair photolyase
LALTDDDALDRTRLYLAREGIGTTKFSFSEASNNRRKMTGIRTQARDRVHAIRRLIEWPTWPDPEWRKGFLAGIFDAEGGYSQGVWRIANTDPQIIGWTVSSMRSLDFDVVVEDADRSNGMRYIRLLGGLKEVLRFFHTTEPAITRKRSIEGMALKSDAPLRVASIEAIGMELELFDITTGTGDFIANGVVSHNCFARNTHTYLDMDSGHDFNSRIVVKVNAPQLARKELAAPKWQGEHVAMGTNVDCYQRAEGRYKLMPGIIGALTAADTPFSILTKGTLILRDLDLLLRAADRVQVGLNMSIGFVDESLWHAVEPGTPSPRRRLEAVRALAESGLGCGVLMAPILPYLTDSPEQLRSTVESIVRAGARSVSPIVLHLRPGSREWFAAWLAERYPNLRGRYRALYGKGSYAAKWYQEEITRQVRGYAEEFGLAPPKPPRRLEPPEPEVQPDPAKPGRGAASRDGDDGPDRGEQLTLM